MSTNYPASTEADAKNRAWRTFAQGLLVDVAVAVVLVLTVAFSANIEWTPTYWLALASTVGKTVLLSAVSYASRKLVPPAV